MKLLLSNIKWPFITVSIKAFKSFKNLWDLMVCVHNLHNEFNLSSHKTCIWKMNRRYAEITVLPQVVVDHTLLLSASTASIKASLSHLEWSQCSIFCNQSKRWCQEKLHFVYLPPGHYLARLMSKSGLIAAGKATVICWDDVEENEVPLKADHTAALTVCSCP